MGQHGEAAPAAYCKAAWPDDKQAFDIVQKAAVTPASTTGVTTFNAARISSLVDILGPSTAAAAIFRAAMGVTFDQYQTVWIPGVAASASNVAFVLQGDALPVEQYDLSAGITLTAGMKIGFLSVLTEEVMRSSNAEAVVRAKMAEDFSLGLETLLLDSNAASATRPAGLRNGVVKTTAASGGGLSALASDLGTLAGKVAAVGSTDGLMFIAAAKDAVRAKCLLPASFNYPIYASGGLSDGTLVAIAPRALCVASSDARLDVRDEVTVHMDSAATAITTAGTPTVLAFPVRGLWQTSCVSIRLLCSDIAWGWRGAGLAWTDTVTW
jgi:hypothetical protein